MQRYEQLQLVIVETYCIVMEVNEQPVEQGPDTLGRGSRLQQLTHCNLLPMRALAGSSSIL